MTSAKVILDTYCEDNGCRLTTMEVVFHRFILAEFNTHRKNSRNSASSRAIPTPKLIERVKNDPAIPFHFGKNQKGMMAEEQLPDEIKDEALKLWLTQRDHAVDIVEKLSEMKVHKQVVNRLLEPFMWHTAIVTATNFNNMFYQRSDRNAQPEFRVLSYFMQKAYAESEPQIVQEGYWHTPYIQSDEMWMHQEEKNQISTARCARVSFLNHNGIRSVQDDLDLFGRLRVGTHFSPFEHVAQAMADNKASGNFEGFYQFRKFFDNEYVSNFELNYLQEEEAIAELIGLAA